MGKHRNKKSKKRSVKKHIKDRCPKCKEYHFLTRHHVYPQCFWGATLHTEMICRKCHNDLEYFIQRIEGKDQDNRRIQLPRKSYLNIYRLFISL